MSDQSNSATGASSFLLRLMKKHPERVTLTKHIALKQNLLSKLPLLCWGQCLLNWFIHSFVHQPTTEDLSLIKHITRGWSCSQGHSDSQMGQWAVAQYQREQDRQAVIWSKSLVNRCISLLLTETHTANWMAQQQFLCIQKSAQCNFRLFLPKTLIWKKKPSNLIDEWQIFC